MTKLELFEHFLWSQEEKIVKALPSHVSVKRFISSTISYIVTAKGQAKLLESDANTRIQCIMRAAQRGLIIDGVESALVPRAGKCTLMIMVQGLLKMVRNSGELKDIQSAVVYDNDTFDYYTDETGEHLMHRRTWEDRGKRKLVFAIARTKDGGIFVEVLDEKQVADVKKRGYSGEDSPWNGPFADEMWRKSAIRRLSKRLPSATDMESFSQAIHEDDDLFIPQGDNDPAKEEKEPETTSSGLAAAVAPDPKKEPEPEPEKVKEALHIIGKISGLRSKAYGEVTRTIVDVNSKSYGTSDKIISEMLNASVKFKAEIAIFYEERKNSKDKIYNEIIEVKGSSELEESPI